MKYYLHDSNAFNDEKVTMLFLKYGYEGLGLFYTALEKLAAQEKPINTEVLTAQLKVGKHLDKISQYCETLGILCSNNGETFSKQLMNFAEKYRIKNEKNKEKIKQWREKQADTKNVTSYETVRNHPKVKESKVKENKDSIIEADEPPASPKFKKPTIDEIKQYITEKKYSIDAESFFNYYESNGWKVGKNPMKNWPAAVSNWNKRENPKQPTPTRHPELDLNDPNPKLVKL